jgi:hypothetical protein
MGRQRLITLAGLVIENADSVRSYRRGLTAPIQFAPYQTRSLPTKKEPHHEQRQTEHSIRPTEKKE